MIKIKSSYQMTGTGCFLMYLKYELIAQTKKHHWSLGQPCTFGEIPVKLIKRNINVWVGLVSNFAQFF